MADHDARGPYIVQNYYVAFCDILGFSHRILTRFDDTLEAYDGFVGLLEKYEFRDVELTVYSDAILFTARDLAPLLSACQTLLFYSLAHDFVVRGGIAYGRYWKREIGRHLFVVSDALVKAVEIEKSQARYPRILIDPAIEIPLDFWVTRFQHEETTQNGLLASPVLHYEGQNIVNPFNYFWMASARSRIAGMRVGNPGHEDKYDWFLRLAEAVWRHETLVPEEIVEELLTKEIIYRKEGAEKR